MFKLNKVDQEILGILKTVFLTKNVIPMQSDDHLRLWIIRSLFVVSVFTLLVRLFIDFSEQEMTTEMSRVINSPIALFFGVLFLHINNESKNTSLILFLITWVSIVLALYI